MCWKIVLVLETRMMEVFSCGLYNEYGLKNEAILVKSIATSSGETNHILFGRNGMLAYYSIPFVVNSLSHSPCFIHFITLVNLNLTEINFDAFHG